MLPAILPAVPHPAKAPGSFGYRQSLPVIPAKAGIQKPAALAIDKEPIFRRR